MENVLVSVIVLTYCKFDNLENNLKSIQDQDYSNIEIVISDDCSPAFNADEIYCLCKKTGLKFQIISHNKNLGTVKNYDSAIKAANGKIIIPLSQDDTFYNMKSVSSIVSFFEKTKCDVCTAKRLGSKSHIIYPQKNDADILLEKKQHDLIIRLLLSNFISGSVLYFKKDIYNSIGFDKDFVLLEDYPFVMRLIEKNVQLDFMDQIVLTYGESGVSSGKNISNILLRDMQLMYTKYLIPLSSRYSHSLRKYVKWKYTWFMNYNNPIKKKISQIISLNTSILVLKYKCIAKKNKRDFTSCIYQWMKKC